MEDKKSIWTEAGNAGLVLGGVSILYMAANWLLGKCQTENVALAMLTSMMSLALWAAKFYACIKLMQTFMTRFSEANPDADNSDTFRFGALTGMLSAVVYSAAYLAYMQFIAPGMLEQAMEAMKEMPLIDANTLSQMERMMPKMPVITTITNLFYCSIFGIVLSAILSRNIPSRNPFEGGKTEE
ncbi:MAG: DUF4199 domain-containing protein [Bacteroidales bacterium]|nr:DUF4199 domain-containing protein [Candidatus Cryptobacteroides equifaecalis]